MPLACIADAWNGKIARRIVLLTTHGLSIPTTIGKTGLVVTLPHGIGLFTDAGDERPCPF